MNKELLYRFFEGKTSLDEEKQLREWMDASPHNSLAFFRERQEYDALLLVSPPQKAKKQNTPRLLPWLIGSVASVVLLLLVGGFYFWAAQTPSEQYNTVLVPAGQRINLILSDNTQVWLNANTTFRYPSQFAKTRSVFLDGEAYFEVSKNPRKPFVVTTPQGNVQVTGTTFNVEAYAKYNSFTTSLFSGSVDIYKDKVKLASLQPNEKSEWINNQLCISTITDSDEYLWRNGLIAFNNKKLEEIFTSLEKYFDTTILMDVKKLPQHTYTGKFRQSDGIDYALRVLQKSIRFNFERDDESGTIYIK